MASLAMLLGWHIRNAASDTSPVQANVVDEASPPTATWSPSNALDVFCAAMATFTGSLATTCSTAAPIVTSAEADLSGASEQTGPVLLAGDAEIDSPSLTTTIMATDGSPLTIGPVGAIAGTTTVPFPPFPTTATVEGVTLTFETQRTIQQSDLPALMAGATGIEAPLSTIVTSVDGQSFTIGPSGIVAGGTNVPYPSRPTTVTAGDVTLTFGALTTLQPSRTPSLVIGGSVIGLPSASTIVTTIEGRPFTFGPAGIVASATVVPFPSEPTVITTDGIKLTFDTPSATGAEGGDDNGVATGAGPKMTGPAVTDFVLTEPGPAAMFALDGESYVLPATGSIELLQLDGSMLTLFPDSLVSASQTASIDPSAPQSTQAFGDFTIDSGPAPGGSPDTGGAPGFEGLTNALSSLSDTARSIVSTLDKIDNLGTQWSAGGLSTSQFSISAPSLFDDAIAGLSNFQSTLRSTLVSADAEGYELTELTPDGQRVVSQAYPASQQQFDLTGSLRKLVLNVRTLRDSTVNAVKAYWEPGATVALALADATAKLEHFAERDWKQEKQTSSQAISTSTSATSTSRTSTSSSESSSATAVPYFLSTNYGTDPALLDDFLRSMSLNYDDGPLGRFPTGKWQGQVLNLTAEQVKRAESQPFMDFVVPDDRTLVFEQDDEALVDGEASVLRARTPEDLTRRPDSASHLKLISAKNQREVAEMLADLSRQDPELTQLGTQGLGIATARSASWRAGRPRWAISSLAVQVSCTGGMGPLGNRWIRRSRLA